LINLEYNNNVKKIIYKYLPLVIINFLVKYLTLKKIMILVQYVQAKIYNVMLLVIKISKINIWIIISKMYVKFKNKKVFINKTILIIILINIFKKHKNSIFKKIKKLSIKKNKIN